MTRKFDIKIKKFETYDRYGSRSSLGDDQTMCLKESLTGNGTVSLDIADGVNNIRVSSLNVFIYPLDDKKISFHGVLFIEREEFSWGETTLGLGFINPEQSNLSVHITREIFERLRENRSGELSLSFTIPEENKFDEEGRFVCNVEGTRYHIAEKLFVTPSTLSYQLVDEITGKWQEQFGLDIAEIGREMLQNMENVIGANQSLQVDIGLSVIWIENILSELESCYEVKDIDGCAVHFTPNALNQALKRFPADKRQAKTKIHDTLWLHSDINSIVASGKIKNCDYAELNVYALENVARLYKNSDQWIRSSKLDWILVNAMVFGETIAFARGIADDMPRGKYLGNLGFVLRKSFGSLFKGAVALAITALIASFFDSEHGVIFWIIFATITLGRWQDPLRVMKLELEIKPKMLMYEMQAVYNKLATVDFNPRLIRDLLYKLEGMGAIYSPWVYHILDKMVVSSVWQKTTYNACNEYI